MTDQWRDSADERPAVGKVEAVPIPGNEDAISRRQMMEILRKIVGDVLGDVAGNAASLTAEYYVSKVAQGTNSARKTLAEAGEIAARERRTDSEADLKRQETVAKKLENMKAIPELPLEYRPAALKAFLLENPELEDVIAPIIESLKAKMNNLALQKGAYFSEAPSRALVSPDEDGD
ncbi:MAG: hypothetical protein IID44_21665 [Planctomycetes bacterium]|nr:hypothetical protein [Planctomycetota bacterium]